jgi:hypothetical protein
VVEIGTDDDGDAVTSCVVVETAGLSGPEPGRNGKQITANQRRFLDILRTAIIEAADDPRNTTKVPNGVKAVSRDMLRRYCVNMGWLDEGNGGEKAHAKARAKLSDILNVLAGKNLIGLTNRHVWIP